MWNPYLMGAILIKSTIEIFIINKKIKLESYIAFFKH